MVPVPSVLRNDGGCGGGGDACATDMDDGSFGRLIINQIAAAEHENDNPCSEACVGSDPIGFGIGHDHMAEEDSRTSSLNEAGSSSKGCGGGRGAGAGDGGPGDAQEEQEEQEGSWLQLGIGGGDRKDPKLYLQDPLQNNGKRPAGLFELDLKPPGGGRGGGGGGGSSTSMTELILAPFSPNTARAPPPPLQPPFFFQQQQYPRAATSLTRLVFPHQREFAWGSYNRPNPNFPWSTQSSPPSPSSSSSSMLPGPYYARIFQCPGTGVDAAGPSSNSDVIVRVIDAPPRPHSGVWFVLQASQNQAKQPFLPQIPKSFLRIKDGRMTVLLLMKYLVNKLRLDSESEVEIRCRGQQLAPVLTLQHVRDNIWSSNCSGRRPPSSSTSRDAMALLPDSSTSTSSSTTDHFIMILHYGRTA